MHLRAALLALMAINAQAQQQAPPPPTTQANADTAIKAQQRTPPPPAPPMRSNGSTGWVITTKPVHISPADIPPMFPAR